MVMTSVLPEPSPAPAMNPLLLASACSGYLKGLNILLNGENASGDEKLPFDLQATYTPGTIPVESLLDGVTVEGDTALHAVASNGDGDNFLSSADLIYSKAEHLMFVQNKRGDTPLHLAAREGKFQMVVRLVDLAKGNTVGISRATTSTINAPAVAMLKRLLETKNKLEETALHEAIRIESDKMVSLLMDEDPELAMVPEKGTSPLYLAILFDKKSIAETLYEKSGGVLSYSGPNGQNALHAAVRRGPNLTRMMLKWNKDLTTETDENGSTPLHFAAEQPGRGSGSVCQQLVEANPAALYQSDKYGFFPIHAAAYVRDRTTVAMFVKRYPGTAGLRDAKGRTFLHVAIEKKIIQVVSFASGYKPISWILNMRDGNGNTALHLAVQKGGLIMVSFLLANLQVKINLTNDKGKTPLDISQDKISPVEFFYTQNSRALIQYLFTLVGARRDASRRNPVNNENINEDDNESEMIKETTNGMITASVLIATVTFGATFALPGGYIADDHKNGGTPTRAGRYAFDAFMIVNAFSFVCSSVATMGFVRSGSPMVDLESRKSYLGISAYLMETSISSMAVAFALAVHVVLAPIAHKTATAICVLSSLVGLSTQLEFCAKKLFILPTVVARIGLFKAVLWITGVLVVKLIFEFWPIIFTFGWAAYQRANP